MTGDVYVERAARHAVQLFGRIHVDSDRWDECSEPYQQGMRADVAEVLDASGYPAALDEAAELLRAVVKNPTDRSTRRLAFAWLAYNAPDQETP